MTKEIRVVGNTQTYNAETGYTTTTLLVAGIEENIIVEVKMEFSPQARRTWIEGFLDHHECWEAEHAGRPET